MTLSYNNPDAGRGHLPFLHLFPCSVKNSWSIVSFLLLSHFFVSNTDAFGGAEGKDFAFYQTVICVSICAGAWVCTGVWEPKRTSVTVSKALSALISFGTGPLTSLELTE